MLTKSYVGIMLMAAVGSLLLALLVMLSTTPLELGPIGVTAWFILVLLGLTAICALGAYALANRLQPSAQTPRKITDSARRGLMLGGYLTTVLALSSLRQLNPRDVILLAILLLLVEFYTVARA